jgi:hypothetical protein
MFLRKRTLPILLIGMLGLLGPAMTATAPAQTIVVTAKSIKDLAGDLEYLIKAVAPEGDPNVERILGALRDFQAGDLVKGLDQSRGFGLAVTLPPDFPGGDPPSIVAAVPVTDLGAFLDSLKGLGIAVDDQPGVAGFSHKVTAPDGNTNLFVLQSKGYALFSLIPGADKLKGLDPASWGPERRPGAVIAARVRIAELPKALKDQFLEQFKASLDQQEQRKPGEKDAEYQGRIAAQKAGEATITALVRDGDSIAMALDVDRKNSEMSLDLTIAAKPGTETAGALRGFGSRRSRFEGLGGGGPLAFWANIPVAKVLREGFARGFNAAQKTEPAGLDTPEKRELYARLMELLKSNFDADDFDGGLAFRRNTTEGGAPTRYTVLTGLKVRDGKAFDRWFRDSVAQFKPDDPKFQFTLDVAKAADGTAIHQLTGPFDKNDANMGRVLGKAALAVAFRDDAILAAFGEDGVAAVRRGLEMISSPPTPDSGSAEPVALVARLSGFDALPDTQKEREAYRRAAAEAFRGEAAKRDRIRMAISGEGDAIRLHLGVDVPALKFLAAVGQAMKN